MPNTISSRCFSVILVLERHTCLTSLTDFNTAHDKFPIKFIPIGRECHGQKALVV